MSSVKLGNSATAANNFVLEADGAGGFKVKRENGTVVMSVDASGNVDAFSVTGTWTPTLTSFGGTVSTVTATYVRVGKTVTIRVSFAGTGITTTANTTKFTLPPGLVPVAPYVGSAMDSNMATVGGLWMGTAGDAWLTTFASSSLIVVTGTYMVA